VKEGFEKFKNQDVLCRIATASKQDLETNMLILKSIYMHLLIFALVGLDASSVY